MTDVAATTAVARTERCHIFEALKFADALGSVLST
jgi:hypothetical protein